MSIEASGPVDAIPAAAPARHDLLRVDPAGWPVVLATFGDAPDLSLAVGALVRGWAEAGRPATPCRWACRCPPASAGPASP